MFGTQNPSIIKVYKFQVLFWNFNFNGWNTGCTPKKLLDACLSAWMERIESQFMYLILDYFGNGAFCFYVWISLTDFEPKDEGAKKTRRFSNTYFTRLKKQSILILSDFLWHAFNIRGHNYSLEGI